MSLQIKFIGVFITTVILGVQAFNVFPPQLKFGRNSKTGSITPFISLHEHNQKLDHFNESDTRTFVQRYLENDLYYRPGGPIICFIGGQETLVSEFITGGPVKDIAVSQNGLIIYPEHRYFGLSRPFSDLTTENLSFMKVDQILADIDYFIKYIKSTNDNLKHSKVVVIGSSLAGTYVSWFRLKYPDVTVGGWASSGPILAKASVSTYKEEVGQVFRKFGGRKCYNKIKASFNELEQLINDGDVEKIEETLKLCTKLDPSDKKSVSLLFHTLSSFYGFYTTSSPVSAIEEICNKMVQTPDNIEAIAVGIDQWLSIMPCINVDYNIAIDLLKNSTDVVGDSRAFFYYGCNELGWFITSESTKQPFGSMPKLPFWVDFCNDIFDQGITEDDMHSHANHLNEIYGGLNATFTNVFSTQGELDPNRVTGLTNNLNPTSPTTVIKYATHANDLYYFLPGTNTFEVRAARLQAKLLIADWLKQ